MADSDAERPPAVRSPFDPRSEVGRALAEVDWAATDLGPWEQWPVSLSTAVRAMLGSRFSMCMLYGERAVFLCNDAYRVDSMGDKFPDGLGKPLVDVWPEVWDVASERIRSVKVDGVATWDESLLLFLQRSGYTEESYHTFCYGPLHDDVGETVGVLCVVNEDTDRVLADRRMALLRDVGEAIAAGTTRDSIAVSAHRALSGGAPDLPFVVAYVADAEDPDAFDLHWAAGAPVGGPATPRRVVRGDGHPWADAMFTESLGHSVVPLAADVAWPTGSWSDPPRQALVLPLRALAQHQPLGYLVVGLNPYRALDSDYAGFVQLLAEQLSSALARAAAFEQERERHDQLAALDRAKTTFFTNISHELRTPLTLLLGPAEDALRDSVHALNATQRQRFEVVARNGARLLKLVNTLLDFSRLEDGRATAHYEPLDLSRLTVELTGMFDSALRRAGLTLEVDCAPLPGRTYVDREMWAKIVLNLLSNALKATFTGQVTVRLVDDPEHGGARLEVSDTGIGIPAGEVDRLFERFHRVSGARQRSHEGTGIGLALVAELVRLHGGEIGVRSTPGEGSTFTVRIPYGAAHLPADHVVEQSGDGQDISEIGAGYVAESLRWSSDDDEASSSTASATAGRGPRVLVVDDNADVRDYVVTLLNDDYAVHSARDGEEALAAVRSHPPDLVLTDVMMPVLDGFGLLTALRADPTTAHIPVIMLSARSGENAAVEGLEAGADDYIVKPFTARELRARVRANLELDRVRGVLAELERSRDMLDNAEQLARLASWEYDLHHGTLQVSPQFARTVGLDLPPLTPVKWDGSVAVTSPDDAPRLRAAFERLLDDHEDIDVEVRSVRASGERFLARVRASITLDEAGAPHYLRGSTQDVTEQRAAEAELAAAHAMREVASREHAIATELQRSLLPQQEFAAGDLEIASFYRAGVEGTQVGGDWYDVIDLGLGRTALVIGDVMGRGVRAAAVMGQLRAATRAYARLELPPAELISLLDDTVRELGQDTIVTCVYAVYDPADHTLEYANAGHPPPLLRIGDQAAQRLEHGGPPLGAGGRAADGARVEFPPGAVLTLYTDGLVERRDAELDAQINRLAAELRATDGNLAGVPRELVARLQSDDADDDVAVLVCRAGPRAVGERDARLVVGRGDQAIGAARRFVLDTLHSWGVGRAVDDDVQLATSELVTNAINHGGRPVELHLRTTPGRLRLAVRDGGGGRPVVRRSGPRDEHGRGVLIVAAVADSWGVEDGASGKTVWCEFVLDSSSEELAG